MKISHILNKTDDLLQILQDKSAAVDLGVPSTYDMLPVNT